jgi:ABC-type transport system involved in multi-copper enzyme maturation permease subunit
MTIFQIARFEFRYLLRSPQAIGSGIVFLALGSIAFLYINDEGALDLFRLGRNVNVNSPFYISVCMMALSLLAFFVAPSFVGDAIVRDRENRFASIVYTTSVSRAEYLLGRFIGSFAALVVVYLAAPLGMLISVFWLPLPAIGPLHIGAYVFTFLILALPTLFVLSAMTFVVALITRQLVYTYLANMAVAVLMFAISVASARSGLVSGSIFAWLDPSLLLILVSGATTSWSPAQFNSSVITLDGVGTLMLLNRFLFLLIGLFWLALGRALFNFRTAAPRVPVRSAAGAEKVTPDDSAESLRDFGEGVSQTEPEWRMATAWRQLACRVGFEFRALLFSPSFLVMTVLSLFFLVNQMRWYAGVSYPVTTIILQSLTSGTVAIYVVLVVLIFSPEIIWREQKFNFHEIIDALPAPNWVFVVSKLLALLLLMITILLIGAGTGIVIQLLAGETPDIPLYLERVTFSLFVPLLVIAVISCFLQVVTPNRYLGGLLLLLYLGLAWLLSLFGYDHPLYQNPVTGDIAAPLSEMNSQDRFMIGGYWLRAYWLAQAGLLILATYLLWNRGTRQPLHYRLAKLRQLRKPGFLITATCFCLITLGSGAVIFYNMNVLNDYVTTRDTVAFLAEHERRFSGYSNLPMPRIADVSMEVDIFPYDRRIETRSTQVLENRSGRSIESIHLEFQPGVDVVSLTVEDASSGLQDAEFGYFIFDLESPLLPGQSLTMEVRTLVQQQGFTGKNEDITLVRNGTNFDNSKIVPHVGYSGSWIISDTATREEYGLGPILFFGRLEDPPDSFYRRNHLARSDSDLVNYRATVSTVVGQTALTAGKLIDRWTDNSRQYFSYETSVPVPFIIPFLSAEYAMERDEWNGIAIEIYYHPGHEYNLETMRETLEDGLAYFSEAFGPYQYDVLRVVEYPGYRTNSRALPTIIAHSEANGMLERNPAGTVGTIGHELSHHWWGHQVISARVEGALMMAESLANYSASLLLEEKYGEEYFLNSPFGSPIPRYLRQRNRDRSGEVPLDRVGTQNYIGYLKGEIVMFALRDYLGEDLVNRALRRVTLEKGNLSGNYAVSTDFVDILKQEAGSGNIGLIEDMLQRITIYDLELSDSDVQILEDGKYRIVLSVTTGKSYSDSSGLETKATFDIPVDIGLFTRSPRVFDFDTTNDVIQLEKRTFADGVSTLELVVDELPAFVGIDPYNRLIDKNPDDNVLRIAPP